jgi:hypothetical protein
MNRREETSEVPGMQKWHKEPRLRGAATSWKREDNQRDLQEEHRTGICEASNRDVQRVAENEEPGIVDGSTPSETVEAPLAFLA